MPDAATTRKKPRGPHSDPAYWDHGLLSIEEARALARRAQSGDAAAREELILKHQRLVVSIARRHLGGFYSLQDLVSIGNRGLMHAIGKYDADNRSPFAHYAARWISQAIGREILNSGAAVRMPSHVHEDIQRYRKAARATREAGGAPASFDEVCASLGWAAERVGRVRDALALLARDCSPIRPDDDRIASAGDGRESDAAEDRAEAVARLLARLEARAPRQAHVVRKLFGIGGGDPLSAVELGRLEGKQYQAIQVTRDAAFKNLRSMVDARRMAV